MTRILRGLAALMVLLAGVVGVPVGLVLLGGNPFPGEVSPAALRARLLGPDDGTVLVGLVTVVGWLAWLVFVASVLVEALTVGSGRHGLLRLPGLSRPRRWAALLVVPVAALLAAPVAAQATPAPLRPEPVPDRPAPSEDRSVPVVDEAPSTGSDTRHVVQPGDDLWSLAEHYYGNGRDWRRIAAANPSVLTGGPDRLQPGWRLRIPDPTGPPDDLPAGRRVTVKAGDTLSSIAEAELGSSANWPALYRANRSQLSSPDQIDVGMQLLLPGEQHARHPRAREPVARDETPRPVRPPYRADFPARDPGSVPERPPAATPVHVPAAMAGIGGLLAAGLLAGLAARRRIQLSARPVGRRILHPSPAAQVLESQLDRRARPISLRTLDLAMRAVAAHCRQTETALPALQLARVSDDELELTMAAPAEVAPVGFTVSGCSWRLDRADAEYLKSVPGLNEVARPYPALVSLGRDGDDALILVDLEAAGVLTVDCTDRSAVTALLEAIALELSFSPWAPELTLTVVGERPDLARAVGLPNVTHTPDLDAALDRLGQRAREQRQHLSGGTTPAQQRLEPDLADPWAAEIILVETELSDTQAARLRSILLEEPRPAMAAVVPGGAADASWSLRMERAASTHSGTRWAATLAPYDVDLTPQLIDEDLDRPLLELIGATGSSDTTPAPWWHESSASVESGDNVTFIGARLNGWGREESARVDDMVAGPPDAGTRHPLLRLLGPIDLLGAAGCPPARAEKQCLEYCAWLLEHPGTTAQQMSAALAVAEGTRRSNMSRLRSWLGVDDQGDPYLPDAYSGRIRLHPCVSSDWHRLQLLTATGVNRAATENLRRALDLVRGAPLADAAPGQWHWAEELRTDMSSVIRDIGIELSARALASHDLDLARWAASRSLVAAPEDERLLCARIRTEHAAGNVAAVERLALQLAAHARETGVDIDPETVVLLQQVLEGRPRARLA
ncbi:hypothetical protein GCM10009841_04700 [Microlunatus panaciterrae]|uniref:LysM repeat protein n=1 Tax=Microlunatus panaciterrae TaxID=400768 RepID=A0ABS2RIR9_9ACTN|nr:LysM peptidoglycan-binding domain-containing protein [Microlunatus panaciterrae]MBM7798872.1 LysM repeat protein [Microlunatus panaciterrae]